MLTTTAGRHRRSWHLHAVHGGQPGFRSLRTRYDRSGLPQVLMAMVVAPATGRQLGVDVPGNTRTPRAAEPFARELDPVTAVLVTFMDGHPDLLRVAPICAVLTEPGCTIAPSSGYAATTRRDCAPAVAGEAMIAKITRMHANRPAGRRLCGMHKLWHRLRRGGVVVARRQAAEESLCAGRGSERRDTAYHRDRACRHAAGPGHAALHREPPERPVASRFRVGDEPVGTASGAFVLTSSVGGSSAGAAASMRTKLPLEALEMALRTRALGEHGVKRVRSLSQRRRIAVHVEPARQQPCRRRVDRARPPGSATTILSRSVVGLYRKGGSTFCEPR